MNATKVSFENHGYIEISSGPEGIVVLFSQKCPRATLIFENKGISGNLVSNIAISTKEIIKTEKNKAYEALQALINNNTD